MGLLASVSHFIKVHFLQNAVTIDNVVFRLHYQFTSGILFLCCILSAINNFNDSSFKCYIEDIPSNFANGLCWSKRTYSLPTTASVNNTEARYNHMWPWIPFIFFVQGVVFYLPHYMWRSLEQGRVSMLSEGLGNGMVASPEDRVDRQSRLVKYLLDTSRLHNAYAFCYSLCEGQNMMNAVSNLRFVDWLVGGTFSTYGLEVFNILNTEQENRTDPMIAVFPHIIRCDFHRLGPSGSIQIFRGMCTFTVNSFNEKAYTLLWFWFIILTVVSVLAMLYTSLIGFVPVFHEIILKWFCGVDTPKGVFRPFNMSQMGDYFLLHLLSLNINRVSFGEILHRLKHSRNDHAPNIALPPSSSYEMTASYAAPDKAD